MHLPTTWRKSSHSGQEEHCVEVADTRTHHHVRDSKLTPGPTLAFTHAQWHTFTTRPPHP